MIKLWIYENHICELRDITAMSTWSIALILGATKF